MRYCVLPGLVPKCLMHNLKGLPVCAPCPGSALPCLPACRSMMQASTYNCAFWTMQKPAGYVAQQ